jgi:uncharacterized phiE125 gp8 family phage protein
MAIEVLDGPEYEPVTLHDAKAQLRLEVDEDDPLVYNRITAAREWVEGQTKRALSPRTLLYSHDYGWPRRNGFLHIRLPVNPVTAVASVKYVDASGVLQTLADTEYTAVCRESGSYIVPAYNKTWPEALAVPNSVQVEFVAGYAAAPEGIKAAVMLLVAHMYENREPVGKPLVEVPYSIDALIAPYRDSRL